MLEVACVALAMHDIWLCATGQKTSEFGAANDSMRLAVDASGPNKRSLKHAHCAARSPNMMVTVLRSPTQKHVKAERHSL